MYEKIKVLGILTDRSYTMVKNFFVNPFEKKENNDPMAPSYIKPDGTKVIEKQEGLGLNVYEKCPDGALIFRSYDKQNRLVLDFARDRNFEIGNQYDDAGNVIYKYESVYDENNKLAIKKEYDIEYYDNNTKKSEIITVFPNEFTTYIHYDESGKRVEKIEERGTVKTFFDENDKPIKREIDRGSGGIITEDLRNQ
ncbi:unknown [Fusobacterium sp. CAG:439]|nr:unknown [Fusobacterium sp. CAG:439]